MKEPCPICKTEITEDQEIDGCPVCPGIFHLQHLQVWLLDHSKCPRCRKTFPPTFLSDIRQRPLKPSDGQLGSLPAGKALEEIQGSDQIIRRVARGQCSVCGNPPHGFIQSLTKYPFCSTSHLAYYKPREVLILSVFSIALWLFLLQLTADYLISFFDFLSFFIFAVLFLPLIYFVLRLGLEAANGWMKGKYLRKVLMYLSQLRRQYRASVLGSDAST